MTNRKKHIIFIGILALLLPFCILLNLVSGQIEIPFSEIFTAVFNYNKENPLHLIFIEFRIPRMSMALLAGSALSLSGMLMQTLFNNPLAGPYVLGINSGASLFVALSILTGIPIFLSDFGLISAALTGSFVFSSLILVCSFLVRSHVSLLLIGLMISSFVGAIISLLESISQAEQLKAFSFWTFGSLQQTSLDQLPVIILLVGISIISSFILVKPLNAFVLGENSARNLGINIRMVRFGVIGTTAILTGIITAFCGPIAFVGLAIPNLARIIFKTQQHQVLIISNLLLGGLFLLLSDSIIQVLEPWFVIPINAFTSILGAPFVIYMLIKKLV